MIVALDRPGSESQTDNMNFCEGMGGNGFVKYVLGLRIFLLDERRISQKSGANCERITVTDRSLSPQNLIVIFFVTINGNQLAVHPAHLFRINSHQRKFSARWCASDEFSLSIIRTWYERWCYTIFLIVMKILEDKIIISENEESKTFNKKN